MNKLQNFKIADRSCRIWDLLSFLFFAGAAILSVLTTYYVTGNLLDSDASSEMILAKQLSETGNILSKDWLYSTELRVLNTQLVFAPLFLIFDDWHTVRFCGTVILQIIFILSYGFLLKEAGFSKRQFWFSAGILLLPVSVAYGRIVLYHCYYIPHITLSFFLLGLTIGYSKKVNWKRPLPYFRLILLIGFSFLGGLGGVRHLMITHAPTLVCVIVFCLLEDAKGNDIKKSSIFSPIKLQLICCSVIAALFSLVGFKINNDVLNNYYSFGSYSSGSYAETALGLLDFTKLEDLLYGYMHQFGFRQNIPMMSLLGILSLGGVFAAGYSLYICIKKISRYTRRDNLQSAIVQSFFFYYTVVMVAVFLLTGKTSFYYFPLYLCLCLPWAVPLLVSHWTDIPSNMHPFYPQKLFSWVAILILILNGLANAAFFNGNQKFDQPYEGLTFQLTDTKAQQAEVISFLTENGYTLGYSTFWEGNVMTEITNGEIQVINIVNYPETGNIAYYDWLTPLHLRDEPNENPFLLIPVSFSEVFQTSDSFQYCTLVYEDAYQCVYSISELEQFVVTLYS